jgi:crotonobetainyl-CoA:carnitine CoA-transferase CaiB-like acyl-CoA transferase
MTPALVLADRGSMSDNGRGQMLDGLRVLEAGDSVGVHYASALLADLGATVIAVDAGKSGVGSDIAATGPAADDAELRFLDRNVTARRLEELTDDDFDVCLCDDTALSAQLEALAATRPLAVVDWPPAHHHAAYGPAVSSLAGASWAIGSPGRSPLDIPDDAGSYFLGVVLAGVVLAAGLKGEPGIARYQAVGMLESFLEQNVTSYSVRQIPWQREGHRASQCAGIFPYGVYECADGQVAMMGRSSRDWQEIAISVGEPELAEQYPDAIAIVNDGLIDEVELRLRPRIAGMSRAELGAIAESTGALIAPVMAMGEVLEYDDPLTERGFWTTYDGDRMPGLPLVLR